MYNILGEQKSEIERLNGMLDRIERPDRGESVTHASNRPQTLAWIFHIVATDPRSYEADVRDFLRAADDFRSSFDQHRAPAHKMRAHRQLPQPPSHVAPRTFSEHVHPQQQQQQQQHHSQHFRPHSPEHHRHPNQAHMPSQYFAPPQSVPISPIRPPHSQQPAQHLPHAPAHSLMPDASAAGAVDGLMGPDGQLYLPAGHSGLSYATCTCMSTSY